MTQTFIILRHGHYDEDSARRNLTDRGIRQAESIGVQLFELGYKPDAIHHSIVTRAVETAECVQRAYNIKSGILVPLVRNKELTYEDSRNPLKPIKAFDKKHNVIVAVSHEPNIEDITCGISGKPMSPDHAEGYVYELEDSEWEEIKRAQRINVLTPRI